MCGIAGFIDGGFPDTDPSRLLRDMGQAIAHRGPDGAGEWFDAAAGIGLAHRRLAIIDLSPDATQPMRSPCGRWVVVFNGEIYNYRELRNELERGGQMRRWFSQSDTEVLLAAIACWGIDTALARFDGMFAFALWDRQDRRLTLARDRFGEKPLYYGTIGRRFAFASELKALRTLPEWSGTVDPHGVAALLRHSYIAAPGCIYEGLRKLPAGSQLTVSIGEGRVLCPAPVRYWSALDTLREARSQPIPDEPAGALELLDATLRRAVLARMHADVPLGAFLSGGIDSSLVVATMQAQSARKVRTFSIGSSDASFDEGADAARVAAHLGTDHTALVVEPADALAVIPKLPAIYDEPFADSSQVPTLLVAQLARRHVTVALSGDGGDELFAGYNRHQWAPRVWRQASRMPLSLRRCVARTIQAIPVERWDRIGATAGRLLPAARQRLPGQKLHKLAGVLAADDPLDLYARLLSFWQPPPLTAASVAGTRAQLPGNAEWPRDLPYAEQMMALDSLTYLPDDILVKVDRATMAVSLEGRIPFLDAELFALAWRMPLTLKIRHGTGKWILRQLLHRYVPAALVDRPKMGFGVPIGAWLRGPLRQWAEALLSTPALNDAGLLDPVPIRAAWNRHLAGQAGLEHHLWNVLMYQSWRSHEATR